MHRLDRRAVERRRGVGRRVVDPAHDFRDGLRRPVDAAGIDALGGEGEVEVTSGDETVCTVPIADPYSSAARREHSSVIPPTTFGTAFTSHCEPGSTRSGENARLKSTPAFRPVDSRIGSSCSRVVPGYVVDSSTTSWPSRRRFAISCVAATMIERSGSRCFESGVGSAIRIASACRSAS